jgi:cell division protein FtsW (lipid II flippase)
VNGVDIGAVLLMIVFFLGAVDVLGIPWLVILVVAILAACTVVATWVLTAMRDKRRREGS